MDKTDIEIAKILNNNARISFRRMAAKLDISTKKAINRYKKMKDLLPNSTITLDLEKLGFIAQAVIHIKISYKNELDEIFEKIVHVKNVIIAIKHYGPFEITVIVPFKSFEQLYKIHNEIAKIDGIKELDIHINEPFHDWPLNIYSKLLDNINF